VMVDADKGTVDSRMVELAAALEADEFDPREAGEPIVILIPKRNVETWILCLMGESVEEDTDYSGRLIDRNAVTVAANQLFDWTRPHAEVPDSCVPSLRRGLPEWARIG
jgi:hypothetical protein